MNRTLKALYFLGMLAEMAIRVPHERQRRRITMVVDRVDWSERSLLGLMFVRMFFIVALHEFPMLIEGTHASPSLRFPRQIF